MVCIVFCSVSTYLFVLLEFVDPELGAIKVCSVREVVADNGGLGTSVIYSTHRLIALTPSCILQ